ncbi:helix-turn-helix domain-containing protein [Brevibacillus laterosporus]|uniref:Helix-turn-helix transcriptional regulator n=1 Tax=Brevibacillus laterosporus TaxID=1465 RepID=A0AAP8U4R1_BRELA|nr:helix-turn-helix transcriptional regulator [Brevibacillus laterosporus]ATO48306.1 transcriptional regulator [Brevibacillus laterosporus DSM 25]AYB36917.1 XRE family transcriptional regulator [Brevibacillus laterosporus]MBG9772687.1 DNA-binding protein [Brevibacillus laterosporus]MBG9798201.1 DNA-binding protein [Brevibacillus laterosporus]MBM7107317.1 HTH-type transcriptional regulator Xre [Brevibacillus laterosporus]
MPTIGLRIKALRKQKKWTQQELAARVNVSSQVISNWERAYTNPNHDDISRLAESLEVSADCILFGNKRPDLVKETASSYSAFEALFLSELDKLSEEDKQKALEHVRFLAYLAEQKQKNHDE